MDLGIPLPIKITPEGAIVTEWQLSKDELQTLVAGGRIRITILKGDVPSPIRLEVINEHPPER